MQDHGALRFPTIRGFHPCLRNEKRYNVSGDMFPLIGIVWNLDWLIAESSLARALAEAVGQAKPPPPPAALHSASLARKKEARV